MYVYVVRMYVYMNVCICCTNVCMYVHVRKYVYMNVHVNLSTYKHSLSVFIMYSSVYIYTFCGSSIVQEFLV